MKLAVFMIPPVLACVLLLSGAHAPVKDVVGLPQKLGNGTLFTEVEKKLIVVRCWEDYLPRQKRECIKKYKNI